jgi:hypothetical protein
MVGLMELKQYQAPLCRSSPLLAIDSNMPSAENGNLFNQLSDLRISRQHRWKSSVNLLGVRGCSGAFRTVQNGPEHF